MSPWQRGQRSTAIAAHRGVGAQTRFSPNDTHDELLDGPKDHHSGGEVNLQLISAHLQSNVNHNADEHDSTLMEHEHFLNCKRYIRVLLGDLNADAVFHEPAPDLYIGSALSRRATTPDEGDACDDNDGETATTRHVRRRRSR